MISESMACLGLQSPSLFFPQVITSRTRTPWLGRPPSPSFPCTTASSPCLPQQTRCSIQSPALHRPRRRTLAPPPARCHRSRHCHYSRSPSCLRLSAP
uniref:Uncharacterized protein n=1 Tax=Arundo donax TaxID=35708 RepID=A0A0A8YCT3_ARUDO